MNPLRNAARLSLLLALAWAAGAAAFEMDGMSVTTYRKGDYYNPGPLLDRLVRDNVDWIAINVFVYQDELDSTNIYPHAFKTPDDAEIPYIAAEAGKRGIQSFLKVNVNPTNESLWRGDFAPADVGAWFQSYSAALTHYAQIAQACGIPVLSVGVENKSLTAGGANHDLWTNTIAQVRSVYDGKLVYCANWDEFGAVSFWHALDYVGIDAYFPLTANNNATADDIRAAWTNSTSTDCPGSNWHAAVESIHLASGLDVLFPEIGFPSADDGANWPWSNTLPNLNLALQSNAYAGTIRAWTNTAWLKGMFFWDMRTDMTLGGPTCTNHTPLNKPAENALRELYADVTLNPDPTVPTPLRPIDTSLDTGTPAFVWSYPILPVYDTFGWEDGSAMGWYPETVGDSLAFSSDPAPTSTTERAFEGGHSLKCHMALTNDVDPQTAGLIWADLAEPVDLSNVPVSVCLWIPDELVNPGQYNQMRFAFKDSDWSYLDSKDQNLATGESWAAYCATMPADNEYGGADLSRVQHVGVKIYCPDGYPEQFAGFIYVDNFDFASGTNVLYQLQVDADASFTSAVIDEAAVAAIHYNPSNPVRPSGRYVWRVRADEGAGWNDWSTNAWFIQPNPDPLQISSIAYTGGGLHLTYSNLTRDVTNVTERSFDLADTNGWTVDHTFVPDTEFTDRPLTISNDWTNVFYRTRQELP